MFQEYLNHAMCVIPLKSGIPQVEWSKYFYTLPDDVSGWKSTEYALVCGKVSNVVAIDIDTDDTTRIESLAGVSPVKKKGSKGFTAFYRYNGETSQNWKDSNGNVICEILSDKRLTTIPPSKHRKTGKPYVWMDQDLIGAELPYINDDFILLMDAKFPKPKRFAIEAPKAISDYEDIQLHQAEKMLSYIDANCSRDEWIQIGMALRDEFGDAACHIFHAWSATSPKYNHNHAQSAWRSFSHEGVTIGTLVYFAKRGGWTNEYISTYKKPKEEKITPEPIQEVAIGGLVGEIANWITSTAIRPQPELSLAAALSFVSAMKGHRVQSSMREARTNLLVLSLAPTGGGKDHPQYAIQKLIKRCGIGSMIMGRPTSGTAMLTGLNKSGGIGWLKVDEFGRYLANASGKQAQSHQREIVDYMIELYSCANRTFYGRQYANDRENPQIIIEQPHFCCLGSTVEEKMKEACKSSEVIDGFLNRWLVFSAKDRPKKNLLVKNFEPPEQLVNKITKWINDFPIAKDSYGEITPKEISFTPEAWDLFVQFEAKIECKVESIPYPINELYARAGEHVIKLATTLADDLFVGVPELQWAIHIAEKSIDQIVLFAKGISNNQHEHNVMHVLDVILRAGTTGITQNEVTYYTRRLNNKDRIEILRQLVESNMITFTKDGKKTTYFAG